MTIPKKPLGPGVTVGGFKIKRLLGRGGMGEVYLARQTTMDRDVALKILPARFTKDKEAVQNFLQEVRLQARLEHPNIVVAHEAGEDEGVLFLAMTYVGESLGEKMQRDGPMSEKTALEMVQKLAGALAYAWDEHRLLHRDIKPANIVIDQYGSPRLTDLGLSTSLHHAGDTTDDLVVGTPNYMSPEQAAGDAGIDFHSDMYSLGATLYHMLTGSIPFDGSSVEEILDRQMREPLTDPRDFNPEISDACVELLALMLAKNPDHRHPSWSALIGDVERVLAGTHPSKTPLAPGESAMLRVRALGGGQDEHRKIHLRHSQVLKLQQHGAAGTAGQPHGPLGRAIGKLLLLALILAVTAVLFMRGQRKPAAVPVAAPAPAPQAEQTPAAAQDAILEKKFAEATRYTQENPDDFAGSIRWFEQIREDGFGTGYDIKASGEIRRLEAARQAAMDGVMTKLREEAEPLLADGKLDAATARVLGYSGPLATETEAGRRQLAGELARRAEEARKAETEGLETAKAKLVTLTRAVAADVLNQDFEHAKSRIGAAEGDESVAPVAAELAALKDVTAKVADLPKVLLNSFIADQGREILVAFKTRRQTLLIGAVGADKVKARLRLEAAGFAQRDFAIGELAFEEQMARLGTDSGADRDIMRGLLLRQSPRAASAEAYFRRAGVPLGDALADAVLRDRAETRETEAAKAFGSLLRLAGLPLDSAGTGAVVRTVRRTAYPAADVARIRDAAAKVREAYGDTEKIQAAGALLAALERVDTSPRDLDRSVLDQAVKRVQEANPEVVSLASVFDVNDEGIEMDLSKNRGLANILPLQRLPLTKLSLAETQVRDLTPLLMMPLRILDLRDCPVEDIQALSGMQLEDLNLAGTKVKNVRPLKGMPLRVLNLSGTKVDMLTTLPELPLKVLDLGACPVQDFRPLRELRLEWLSLWKTKIADLKPLKGLPLNTLNVAGTPVTDLSPLAGTSLQTLIVSGTGVSDLTPLKSMPLTELWADFCWNLKDIKALEGLQLSALSISRTPITDLTPIAGMPLKALNIVSTPVKDLSPLKGMATLTHLGWDQWDVFRLMTPTRTALAQNNLDAAAAQANALIETIDGVPALQLFNMALHALVNTRMPDWKAIAQRPAEVRSLAKPFGGHRYALILSITDLKGAQDFCEAQGAHLATIAGKEEMAWILNNCCMPGIPIRIGASDAKKEGTWEWVTGERWGYMNWGQGQPDNFQNRESNLVIMMDGSWHDVSAEFEAAFVAEWDQP